MTADPTASIWEVTRLILDDPEASPQEIAESHGFTMVEIAETLPILLENMQADFSRTTATAAHVHPPEPQPGESAEDFAGRYLAELRESVNVDLASYDSLGERVWFDPELDELLDGPHNGGPSTTAAVSPSTNGSGIAASASDGSSEFGAGGQPATGTSPPDPTTGATTGGDPGRDLDLATDDPFGPDQRQDGDRESDGDHDDRSGDRSTDDGPDEAFDLS